MMAASGPTGPRAWRHAGRLARRSLLVLAVALLLASCARVVAGPATSRRSGTGSGPPGSAASPDPTPTGPQPWSSPSGASPFAFYDPAPVPAGAVHGTLLRYQQVGPVPGSRTGATLWRILYLTRTATGTPVVGSGYIAVPGQAAPAGGYPVISWAHGSTGMAQACAPSLFATTLPGGLRHLILAPYLATLVYHDYPF
ncbi:MAG: hypothetical protein M0Z51_00225, partial [Propionibacterium sp.]|nr:hypothetical protein [Propionibacterium sp.]